MIGALSEAAKTGPARPAAKRALAALRERVDPTMSGAVSLAPMLSGGELSEPE